MARRVQTVGEGGHMLSKDRVTREGNYEHESVANANEAKAAGRDRAPEPSAKMYHTAKGSITINVRRTFRF